MQLSGRQGNTVWTPIITMEITCSRSARQHRPDAVLMLGQHRLNAVLIWYCVKCVMETQLHSCPSGRPQLAFGRRLKKSETDSI